MAVSAKEGVTVSYTVAAIAQGAHASQVNLTVADMLASATQGVKVNYTAGTGGTIQDNAGNALANTAGFQVSW